MTNKTVLITGGTTGIGLATAQLLSAEGARVIVTGLPRQERGRCLCGLSWDPDFLLRLGAESHPRVSLLFHPLFRACYVAAKNILKA